jgi:hypothetical protein
MFCSTPIEEDDRDEEEGWDCVLDDAPDNFEPHAMMK